MAVTRWMAAGLVLGLAVCPAVAARAQSSNDSTQFHAWLSAGVGGGNSDRGGFAGRAAASIAISPLVFLTLEGTSVGNIDGTDDSINLMAGVRSSDPDGFFFLSAGLANTSCGSGCPNQTGVALDGGVHIGGKYAGGALVAFAVRAPGHSSTSGDVLSLDVGLFGARRAATTNTK